MELNKDNIYICDLFYLNYFGINVFFVVCNTRYDEVCLFEVKTKIKKINGEKVEILSKRLSPSKKPYIIPENENSLNKSKFWVSPLKIPFEKDVWLPIKIDASSRIFTLALEEGEGYPITGTAYAKPVENDFRTSCWEYKRKKKTDKYINEIIC